jgi:hypothetical protein
MLKRITNHLNKKTVFKGQTTRFASWSAEIKVITAKQHSAYLAGESRFTFAIRALWEQCGHCKKKIIIFWPRTKTWKLTNCRSPRKPHFWRFWANLFFGLRQPIPGSFRDIPGPGIRQPLLFVQGKRTEIERKRLLSKQKSIMKEKVYCYCHKMKRWSKYRGCSYLTRKTHVNSEAST